MSKENQIDEMRYLANEMEKAISTEYERRVLQDERKLEAVLKANGWRKQEWISVVERLPNDKQEVLTINSQGVMEVCFYEEQWKGIFQQYGGRVKIFNITHWMPLPEAPKMEGGEE